MKPFIKVKKRGQWVTGFASGWNKHLGGVHRRRANKYIRRWLKRDSED